MKDFFHCALFILLCEGAGAIGNFFTIPSIPTWYATLTRPAIAPPNWVFGPAWTTLFALMGIALYLVWKSPKGRARTTALLVFGMQFVLNILWSAIFFGMHNIGGALVEIILLWLAIAATIILFWRISRSAGYLLLPYIGWVSFAAYLTYSFWILN